LFCLQKTGSNLEINIDMNDRNEIRGKIESGSVTANVLDTADKYCVNLLRYSVFPLWKTSPGFKELLKKNNVKDIAEFKESRGDNLKTAKAQLESQIISMDIDGI